MVSDSCKKRFGKIMMEDMELIAQEEIAPRIFSMVLKGEMVEQMLPGQFLHIRVPDGSKLLAVRFQFLRLILRHRLVA